MHQSLQRQAARHVSSAQRHARARERAAAAESRAGGGARDHHVRSGEELHDDDDDSDDDDTYGAVRESGKLIVLDRILPLWQKAGHRCLLFSSTTSMLSIIETVLRRHGFSCVRAWLLLALLLSLIHI